MPAVKRAEERERGLKTSRGVEDLLCALMQERRRMKRRESKANMGIPVSRKETEEKVESVEQEKKRMEIREWEGELKSATDKGMKLRAKEER